MQDELGIRILERPRRDANINFWGWSETCLLIAEASAEIDGHPIRRDPWSDLTNAWAERFGQPDLAHAALRESLPRMPRLQRYSRPEPTSCWGSVTATEPGQTLIPRSNSIRKTPLGESLAAAWHC